MKTEAKKDEAKTVRIVARGLNGFAITCSVEDANSWINRARRIGCDSVVLTGATAKTVFFAKNASPGDSTPRD